MRASVRIGRLPPRSGPPSTAGPSSMVTRRVQPRRRPVSCARAPRGREGAVWPTRIRARPRPSSTTCAVGSSPSAARARRTARRSRPRPARAGPAPAAVSAAVVDADRARARAAASAFHSSSDQPRVARAAGSVKPRPVTVWVISASSPLRSACSSAAMCPSPRCSRSSVAACHRSSSGSFGPRQVGVPGVERAALGAQRRAGLPQQPGQLGDLGDPRRRRPRAAGSVTRGRRRSAPRPPAPARPASRPAGSCARPGTARSCRRSPSPRPPRRRPSARPGRRSSSSAPASGRAR